MSKFRVFDMFAGIGGFTVGLDRAGRFQTEAFCEIDDYCRKVLAKHWGAVGLMAAPDATTAAFEALRGRIDVITAGFPCQDLSRAGKRAGIEGDRSRLYREVLRAVGAIRPEFVIMENSPALLDSGLGSILGPLASLGYDAVWHCIPAAYVGARHHRDRLWIVGYLPDAKSARFEQCWRIECEKDSVEERRVRNGFAKPLPPRTADGIRDRTHRNRVIGNAVVPQIPEIIGRAIMRAHGAAE